jgi:hypothetical protein
MCIYQDATELGGYFDKKSSSTHMVSLWHIPGGCDYNNAEVREIFFDNAESAERFQKMYDCLPEMAMVIPCQQKGA